MTSPLELFAWCARASAASVVALSSLQAQVPPEAEARLRQFYAQGVLRPREVAATWTPDGNAYLVDSGGAQERVLTRHDAATGRRTVLFSSRELLPAAGAAPIRVDDYVLSPDGKRVLIETRHPGNELAAYWELALDTRALRKVADSVTAWELYGPYAPDGRRVRYLRGDTWHTVDLNTAATTALARQSQRDGVNQESRGWSPDGRWFVRVEWDRSAIPKRAELEPTDPTYPRVRERRFARVGGPIARWRIGVVPTGGGDTRWIPVPIPDEGAYLGDLSWTDANELMIERKSRFRDVREVLIATPATGAVRTVFQERDPAWVDAFDANRGLDWIRSSRAVVLLSEKSGWRRAYVVSHEGQQLHALTPDSVDVIARAGIDTAAGWFYYYASPQNPTQRYLYRARLDGKGRPERVTPRDQPGSHDYRISPNGRWAFHTHARFDRAPVTALVSLPDHRTVRVLEDNAELQRRIAALMPGTHEFFTVDIGAGVTMDAWMMKPRAFDPSRRYPLFVYVYGEPFSQTVLDRWQPGMFPLLQTIADLGYVVVSMDNRGTPGPKGAAWRRAVFGSLGPLSTDEQARGVQTLARQRPYVDTTRVGIFGASAGGSNTLNALFRRPDVYHVGIAWAPKPQPHLYNAHFQEIFMRTPALNPDGYRLSAPITFAEGLKGRLLIIHGSGETNTHLQITEGLVDRLIALGRQFDYMVYPNRDHALAEGQGTALHLRMLITRYLLEHLPSGGR